MSLDIKLIYGEKRITFYPTIAINIIMFVGHIQVGFRFRLTFTFTFTFRITFRKIDKKGFILQFYYFSLFRKESKKG